MFKIKNIDPTLKVLAIPISVIVGSLLLFVFIVKIGYPNVTENIKKIDESKKMKNTLEERLNILQDFQAGVLDNQSDRVYSVLPNKNFGAVLISQVKRITSENNWLLEEVETAKIDKFNNEISSATISFKISTDGMESAVNFLQELGESAPLSTINEAVLTFDRGLVVIDLKSDIYWSDLPTKLPSLSEPLVELSAKDRETLSIVQGYKLPVFVDLQPQNRDTGRENPFN